MKFFKLCTCLALVFALFAGCKADETETSERSESGETSAQTEVSGISAKEAYEKFLSGDVSLFTEEDVSVWGLDSWENVLSVGGLEYICLDIDGDGGEELLVQYKGVPAVFNAVLDYEAENLICRQFDTGEGGSFDFPLNDGSMMRQYVFNGTQSYTVFRYDADGEITEFTNLFARTELIPEDSSEPCPYYEIDGKEVTVDEFESVLKENIDGKMLAPSDWTEIK